MSRHLLTLMLSVLFCVWVTACAKRAEAPSEAYYGYAAEVAADYGGADESYEREEL